MVVVSTVLAVLTAILVPCFCVSQWSISYNGNRNNRLKMDGYLEIYGPDDTILYRKEFADSSAISFTDIPRGVQLLDGMRIEYGVRPSGTLYTPTDTPDTDHWIYASGAFSVRLSAIGSVLPVLNISAVNYTRDDTRLSFGTPDVETPAEYIQGFTVPLEKGFLTSEIGLRGDTATTTLRFSTGYIKSLGARDIPKNPTVFSEGGYLVTALDVAQFVADGLQLSSVTEEWNFKRGFYQGADPETTPPTTAAIPVYTLPEYGTEVTEIWGGVFNNSFGDVFLVPVLITTLSIILGGFILFGRRE